MDRLILIVYYNVCIIIYTGYLLLTTDSFVPYAMPFSYSISLTTGTLSAISQYHFCIKMHILHKQT